MEEYDVIIYGTDLVQSIVGAALSWQGVSVLHVDKSPYYGGASATLSLTEIKQWVESNNNDPSSPFDDVKLYVSRNIDTSKYSIDLSPRIIFSASDFIDLLRTSRVYRYLTIKPLTMFHTYKDDFFDKLASTKEDIFTDQSITVQTKRALLKFMRFVLNYQSESSLPIWTDFKNRPIAEFLQAKFKIDPIYSNELVYTLGLCPALATPTSVGLHRIKKYLTSMGVFGSFPAMFSLHGGPGEIAQGFCRSGAVGGAVYRLHSDVSSVDPDTQSIVLDDGTNIKYREKLVIPSQQQGSREVRRLVAIVSNDCKPWFGEGESAAVVVFPPGTLEGNETAVQCLIFGAESQQCQSGQAVWYLSTTEKGAKGKKELELALEKLESAILRESTEDFDIEVSEEDVILRNGTPLISSVRLGQSLKDFVPREKLQYLAKLQYVQHETIANPVADNVIPIGSSAFDITYDGIVEQAKKIFSQITGSDDDFFNVDFEDEDEEDIGEVKPLGSTSNSNSNNNSNAEPELTFGDAMEV
ncbi:hypothetical protein CANCADRAFT_30183 [Tortispora caseinolytica NRRL Y-17796]|uniref:Rab proteins geranylgeranyltransferase n=1 Tax=Tortispora caseinolytica NRRL Y-17796 TaxID=767744 RepID=A0A1E4TJE7_9ASCO|nr:hypothetical protein CANCADRAFT_30183 [Tortispora caseinolytica NRRL Y-17796]